MIICTQVVSRLLFELQNHGDDGNFARGTLTAVAWGFHVCQKTIRSVWKRAVANIASTPRSSYGSNDYCI